MYIVVQRTKRLSSEVITECPILLLYTAISHPQLIHDDVIKWKHFPRYWPFVPVTEEFFSQRPLTRGFDVFFDLRLNKQLGITIETPVIWDVIALIMTSL